LLEGGVHDDLSEDLPRDTRLAPEGGDRPGARAPGGCAEPAADRARRRAAWNDAGAVRGGPGRPPRARARVSDRRYAPALRAGAFCVEAGFCARLSAAMSFSSFATRCSSAS